MNKAHQIWRRWKKRMQIQHFAVDLRKIKIKQNVLNQTAKQNTYSFIYTIFLTIHEKNERHKLTSFSTCGARTASGITVHRTLMSPKADLSTSLPLACIRVSTASTNCSNRGPRMMSSSREKENSVKNLASIVLSNQILFTHFASG